MQPTMMTTMNSVRGTTGGGGSRRSSQKTRTMYIIPPDLYQALFQNYQRRQELLSSPAINAMLDLETKMRNLLQNSVQLSQEQKMEHYSQLLREFLENQEKRWKDQHRQQLGAVSATAAAATATADDDTIATALAPPAPPSLPPAPLSATTGKSSAAAVEHPSSDAVPIAATAAAAAAIEPTPAEFVEFVPEKYRNKVRQVINAIRRKDSQVNFSPKSGELLVDGKPIPGSNIEDLVRYAILPMTGFASATKRSPPTGLGKFLRGLAATNLGTSTLTNADVRKRLEQERLYLHQRQRQTPATTTLAADRPSTSSSSSVSPATAAAVLRQQRRPLMPPLLKRGREYWKNRPIIRLVPESSSRNYGHSVAGPMATEAAAVAEFPFLTTTTTPHRYRDDAADDVVIPSPTTSTPASPAMIGFCNDNDDYDVDELSPRAQAETESWLRSSNPAAWLRLDRNGRVKKPSSAATTTCGDPHRLTHRRRRHRYSPSEAAAAAVLSSPSPRRLRRRSLIPKPVRFE